MGEKCLTSQKPFFLTSRFEVRGGISRLQQRAREKGKGNRETGKGREDPTESAPRLQQAEDVSDGRRSQRILRWKKKEDWKKDWLSVPFSGMQEVRQQSVCFQVLVRFGGEIGSW